MLPELRQTKNPFFLIPKKLKLIIAFPVIIKGIIGAIANGKSPVYIEIKLGIKHNKKAVSKPKH